MTTRTGEQAVLDTREQIITEAARHDIALTEADIVDLDGDLTIDGMAPEQWLEAMAME